MKVLVTGVNGQLGHDVVLELMKRGNLVVGSGSSEASSCHAEYCRLDIRDNAAVISAISSIRPDAVIHCAAWTAVDAAESEENIDKVYAVNSKGTENIARACKQIDCKMLYISTDYVFNGTGTRPWSPDCKDYAPLNVYGKSKLEGELAVSGILEKYFIVRTSWVFGLNGGNFVKTMLKLAKKHDVLRVVNDQIGAPTYTIDLARLLADMIESNKYGYYNATNEGGYVSWYDFSTAILSSAGYNTTLTPVTTTEYGFCVAERPLNSRLDTSKLSSAGFDLLPPWQDALKRYLAELERAQAE